jgi:hypothetical protein
MATVFGTNLYYYSEAYSSVTGGIGAYTIGMQEYLGTLLLAFGRYFVQFFLPIQVSPIDYHPGSAINFLGIIIRVIFFFISIKILKGKSLPFLALFTLPILSTSSRLDKIFANDTYLMLPAIGLLILLGLLIASLPSKLIPKPHYLFPLGLICWVIFFTLSSEQARAWQNRESLYSLAYKKEPTPQVRMVYAKILIEKEDLTQAIQALLPLIEFSSEALELYLGLVLFDKTLNHEQKWNLVNDISNEIPEARYTKASILASRGLFADAHTLLQPLKDKFPLHFAERSGFVAAEYLYFCRKAQNNCADDRLIVINSMKNDSELLSSFKEREKALADSVNLKSNH